MATIPNPQKLNELANESLEAEVQHVLNECEKVLFSIKPPLPEKVIVNIFSEVSQTALKEVTKELNNQKWTVFSSTEQLPHNFDCTALTTLVLEEAK